MTVLIASIFFIEFSLYETTDVEDLKKWFADGWHSGVYTPLDPTKHRLIGDQDSMTVEEVTSLADIVIGTEEMEER